MKRPWNLIDAPVYSLSTQFEGQTNMNICTYVTAVSMKPKRYMVAVYNNTKTLLNIQNNDSFVLQLLSEMQFSVVRNFGQKSGLNWNKHGFIQRKQTIKMQPHENPYSTVVWNGFQVLSNAVSVILLKPIHSHLAGDHVMFLCDVIDFQNFNQSSVLMLNILRDKKIIRI